jgi:dolichol-phosphate mannosyltransferase
MEEHTTRSGILSVILLSYNSGSRIAEAYRKVSGVFAEKGIPFEMIVIDDGSADDSFKQAKALERSVENVKAYRLSRNFMSSYAIFAGLSVCRGSCAVVIPDDEQQPYTTIAEMYRLWAGGEKIIFPYRIARKDPVLSSLYSRMFYFLINRFSQVTFPPGGADTFLIDREVIDLINKRIHPINTSIITEILRLGFNPVFLPYERPVGKNRKSRWSFRKKFRYSLDIFYSSSSFPIKFISYTGLFFSMVSVILILFYLYIRLFGNSTFWGFSPPGWTSIVLFITFFSGLILVSLGVIAEYIWRIYEEVKDRPGYIIRHDTEDDA